MRALWDRGLISIREILEAFRNANGRPTQPFRPLFIAWKQRRLCAGFGKISNAHIFEAVVTRGATVRRLLDDLLRLFGGRSQPVMAQLIESVKLSPDDIREAQKSLRRMARKEKPQ
jgi:BlaI family transcriptional regulator, penicillinase repressor